MRLHSNPKILKYFNGSLCLWPESSDNRWEIMCWLCDCLIAWLVACLDAMGSVVAELDLRAGLCAMFWVTVGSENPWLVILTDSADNQVHVLLFFVPDWMVPSCEEKSNMELA